jgi:hypothetical protein
MDGNQIITELAALFQRYGSDPLAGYQSVAQMSMFIGTHYPEYASAILNSTPISVAKAAELFVQEFPIHTQL